jgi:hypothetical protein
MKNLFLVFLLNIVLLGCITKSKCNDLFPPTVEKETITTIIKKDSLIKGSTIHDSIYFFDTLVIKELKERVIIRQDTSGRTELRYWIDEAGRLRIECESKDQILNWLETYVSQNTLERRTEIPIYIYIIIGIQTLVIGILIYAFSVLNRRLLK